MAAAIPLKVGVEVGKDPLYFLLGMALVGKDFYVANSDAVMRFPYRQGETHIRQPGTKVLDLPAGPINHHWTKNLLPHRHGWGVGAPVVFSHVWPHSADVWDGQMFFLASNGFRCITHDRCGHGRSSQRWYGNDMDTYADDLATLIDSLKLNGITLVGHSTGGGEVARYIGRHGTGHVNKALLMGSVTPLIRKTDANPILTECRWRSSPLSAWASPPTARSSLRIFRRRSMAPTVRGRTSAKAFATRSGCRACRAGRRQESTRLHQGVFRVGFHRGPQAI